jgi:hypothetical protein
MLVPQNTLIFKVIIYKKMSNHKYKTHRFDFSSTTEVAAQPPCTYNKRVAM